MSLSQPSFGISIFDPSIGDKVDGGHLATCRT
jgi:hypothetical protein